MDVQLVTQYIVRQTTVLLAQLSTAAGNGHFGVSMNAQTSSPSRNSRPPMLQPGKAHPRVAMRVSNAAPRGTRCQFFALVVLAVATFGNGCRSNSSDPGGVTDTNTTNWLASCTEDADCGELDCRCGVCTRACSAEADCSDLSATAVCERSDEPSCDLELSCFDDPSPNRDAGERVPDADSGSEQTGTPDDADGAASDEVSSSDDGTSGVMDPSIDSDDGDIDPSLDDDSPGTQTEEDAPANTDETPEDDVGPDDAVTDSGSDDATPGATDDEAVDSGTDDPSADDPGAGDDSNTMVDDGTDSGADACASAQAGAECVDEGAECGGPCTESCSFCNLLTCAAGTWRAREVFPAPCFDCGNSLQCDATQTYCLEDAGSFSCEPLPEPCSSETTCECLGPNVGICSGDAETGLNLQTLPTVSMMCGCTVTTSGSGWCSPEGGFVDQTTPIEWVCGSPGTPNDALNTECVVLPTGAARWCCAESFDPACADN